MLADSVFPNWACSWCVTENQPVTFKDSLSLCSSFIVSKGISLVFCLPLLPLSQTTWLQWRWPHFSDRKCERAVKQVKGGFLKCCLLALMTFHEILSRTEPRKERTKCPLSSKARLGCSYFWQGFTSSLNSWAKGKNERYHQRKLVLAGFLQDFNTVMGKEPKGKELICLCWKKTFNPDNSKFSM